VCDAASNPWWMRWPQTRGLPGVLQDGPTRPAGKGISGTVGSAFGGYARRCRSGGQPGAVGAAVAIDCRARRGIMRGRWGVSGASGRTPCGPWAAGVGP